MPNAPRRAASDGQEGGGGEGEEVEVAEDGSARRASKLLGAAAGRRGIDRGLANFVDEIEPKYVEVCSALLIVFKKGIV